MHPMRLVLGDPHLAFVEALALRLDAESSVHVVAAVGRPADVVRVVRTQPVDVAVLAADGDGEAFLEAGGGLLATHPQLKLVAVTEGGDTAALARAVRLGFRGWVPKEVGVSVLVDVLHAVCRGETWIPPAMLTALLQHLVAETDERRAAEAPLAALTARELEVLRAMTGGASRQEIADRLSISSNTVRTHTQSILGKLGVHTSLAAVTLARRAGLS